MSTGKDYSCMSSEDLLSEIEMLLDELEDMKRERQYLLRLTNVHVSGSRSEGSEAAIDGVEEALREIGAILQESGFGARILDAEARKRP